jgi:aryl-alcohol dehydrogenase-like predicted oxidoreductase
LEDDRTWTLLAELEAVGTERGETMAQTVLAWMLTNPVVSSAIIGANNLRQLDELIPASGKTLRPGEKARLDELSAWS